MHQLGSDTRTCKRLTTEEEQAVFGYVCNIKGAVDIRLPGCVGLALPECCCWDVSQRVEAAPVLQRSRTTRCDLGRI
jgi:hypothetical protein